MRFTMQLSETLFNSSKPPDRRLSRTASKASPALRHIRFHGLETIASDGVTIPFADGHVRQLPRLTRGPFRYQTYADTYLEVAKKYTHVPVKQAVISASALSLLYPQSGIAGYAQEEFIKDLLQENEADIRRCLQKGAY